MHGMRKSVLLLLLSSLLLACNTQSILVKVYTPPPTELPPELRTFSVFSRFVPATGDYERVKWGAYDSVDSVLLEASDTCVKTFTQVFNSFGRYAAKMPQKEPMFKHNGVELPEPLPWEGLVKISQRQITDGIILLESFGIQEKEVQVESTEGVFVASLDIVVSTGWRVCQPNRRRLFEEKVSTYTYTCKAEGKSREAAQSQLPNQTERFLLASAYAGATFARTMEPGFNEVKRKLYVKGHPIIEETAKFVEQGQWGKAESKWNYQAYNGESDELKAMCSYNMALVSEKEGFLFKALGFARRAQNLMPSQVHLDLINELILRSFELEELYKSGKVIKNW